MLQYSLYDMGIIPFKILSVDDEIKLNNCTKEEKEILQYVWFAFCRKADTFADPHAPWQKGGIENTNGIIRQYIPNGTDFKNVSQQKNKMMQRKINPRPREELNFLTPDEVVYKKTL